VSVHYAKRKWRVKTNCIVGNNNVSIIQADISNSVARRGTDLKIGGLIIQGNPPSPASLCGVAFPGRRQAGNPAPQGERTNPFPLPRREVTRGRVITAGNHEVALPILTPTSNRGLLAL
jgi:hypothetical protein